MVSGVELLRFEPDGQVMFLFILDMAASEVSVGLALILQICHQHKTLDVDELMELPDDTELISRKGAIYYWQKKSQCSRFQFVGFAFY